MFREMVAHARALAATGALPDARRREIAQLTLEHEIGRLLCYRVAWMQANGRTPNAEASEAKVFGTEWSQRMTAGAMRLLGMAGPPPAPGNPPAPPPPRPLPPDPHPH